MACKVGLVVFAGNKVEVDAEPPRRSLLEVNEV
jgi:hypothetical protein